jgi:hypothetical protein
VETVSSIHHPQPDLDLDLCLFTVPVLLMLIRLLGPVFVLPGWYGLSLSLCERVSGPCPLLHITTSGNSWRKANVALISSLALLCAYRPKSISEFILQPAHTRTPAPPTLTLDTAEDTEVGCTEAACTDLGTATAEGWGCRWEAGTGMEGWVAVWECESARRFPPAIGR